MAPPSKLSRRRGGTVFLVDIDVDDTAARSARCALSRGDFDACESLLGSCRDPNERAYYLEALGDWPGEPPFLRAWVDAKGSIGAHTAAAIQRLKWAWEARGGGYAPSVGRSAWQEFAARLPDAHDRLMDVLKRDPKDATACPWLMWCARGMSDPELARRAFNEARRRSPRLRAAYSSALLSVSAKWFGSDEEMFDLARTHAGAAPVLLVEAHQYRFEGLGIEDPARREYWKQMAVREEVRHASEAWGRAGLNGMASVRDRHWLAYGLWRCGDHAAAAAHFREIGRVWSQWPWSGFRRGFNWLFNSFGRARRQCLRAG